MRHIWLIMIAALTAGSLVATAPGQAFAAPPEPSKTLSAEDLGPTDKDYAIGKADAPVTIIEYASLTCPHCANFHNTVLPKLKKDYVDTGKVRLVYRDFPLDRAALAASMVARCAGPDRYFGFLDALYRGQAEWTQGSSNPIEGLKKLTRRITLLGQMPNFNVDACLAKKPIQDAILKQRLHGSQKVGVRATPTLIINRKMYTAMAYDDLKVVIDSMLTKP